MAGFRTIEHTADIGIEAWGAALDEVYEAAALGMTYLMADAERIEPRVSRDISVSAGDLEELMFAWLNELLFIIGPALTTVLATSVAPTAGLAPLFSQDQPHAQQDDAETGKQAERHRLVQEQDGPQECRSGGTVNGKDPEWP